MSGELLVGGDAVPHRHDLPAIPFDVVARPLGGGSTWRRERVNAVARCTSCGQLFVSREDPDGWGRVVRWVPLRWWHRKAWQKLRVEEARRIGGVAP